MFICSGCITRYETWQLHVTELTVVEASRHTWLRHGPFLVRTLFLAEAAAISLYANMTSSAC